jgi:hypothetical protein
LPPRSRAPLPLRLRLLYIRAVPLRGKMSDGGDEQYSAPRAHCSRVPPSEGGTVGRARAAPTACARRNLVTTVFRRRARERSGCQWRERWRRAGGRACQRSCLRRCWSCCSRLGPRKIPGVSGGAAGVRRVEGGTRCDGDAAGAEPANHRRGRGHTGVAVSDGGVVGGTRRTLAFKLPAATSAWPIPIPTAARPTAELSPGS